MSALDVSDPGLWQALGAALLGGLLIGFERQVRGRPAGLRTCALIALGSMLFARMGIALESGTGDPARMAGQIAVGVGFLGAGVIFNRRRIVHGMTTAAVVWVLAAIGAIAGIGAPLTALVMAALSVAVLVLVGLLEDRLDFLRRGDHDHKRLERRFASDPEDERPPTDGFPL